MIEGRTARRRGSRVAALLAACAVSLLAGPLPAARADDIRDQEWQLAHVRAPQAWQVARGAGVVVAVIDTGVDAEHPDFAGNVEAGTSLVGASSDGRTDPDGHGTAIAAIIAAHGRGDAGVIGIAPDATILPVDATSNGSSDLVPQGITWAVDHDADVINLSLGMPDTAELRDAVAYAEEHGVVVVAAAGNTEDPSGAVINPEGKVEAPGVYPGLISVSAVTPQDVRTDLSAHGPEVDIAAPGQDVVTALPGDQYGKASGGSSSSAAIVSGVVALVMSAHPDLDSINVINRVIATAKDLGSPGVDQDFGAGLVDAKAAVSAKLPLVTANPLGSLAEGPGDPPDGETDTPQTSQPTSTCDPATPGSGPGGGATAPPSAAGAAALAVPNDVAVSCPPVAIPPITGSVSDGSSALPIVFGAGAAVVVVALVAALMIRRRRTRPPPPPPYGWPGPAA